LKKNQQNPWKYPKIWLLISQFCINAALEILESFFYYKSTIFFLKPLLKGT
jgi:hypothetical protein